ncbi:MAG: adenylate/guanylate cyclase domain-containing protein [Bacteroidota bacterium]
MTQEVYAMPGIGSQTPSYPNIPHITPSQRDSLLRSEADSLLLSAKAFVKAGDLPKALTVAQTGLEYYVQLRDYKSMGGAWHWIASIHYYQGNYKKALDGYEKSGNHYRRCNFTKGIAAAHSNQGAIHHALGHYPAALIQFKKAVKMARSLPTQQQTIISLHNIGAIYLELEDWENAQSYFEQTEAWCRKHGDRKTLSQVLIGLGDIQLQKGNYQEARSHFEDAQELAQELADRQRMLEALYKLGTVFKAQEVYEQSFVYYDQALRLARELDNALYQGRIATALGQLWLGQGSPNKALVRCTEAHALAQELNLIPEQAEACDCLYEANKMLSRNRQALQFYERLMGHRENLKAQETVQMMQQMEFEKELVLDSVAQVEKARRLKAKHYAELAQRKRQRNYLLLVAGVILVLSLGLYSRMLYIKKAKARLQVEKDRSEALLLNILPEKIAEELKEKGEVDAQYRKRVAILFSDFKGFTEIASQLGPQPLVEEINCCFKAFDHIMERYALEKIKTIGDAYMAAGGLPEEDGAAVKRMVRAALEMQRFMARRKKENNLLGKPAFDMRVGIHVGPIVAGIVGIKKFQYDVWGDTVNTASRMESHGAIGKVNISQDTYVLLQDQPDFAFAYRGRIPAKGKGDLAMYFVERVGHTPVVEVPWDKSERALIS